MQTTKKRGRTRKYIEPPEHYGMNIPKGGKYKIKILAKILDKSANEAIMQIIDEKLIELGALQGGNKRISIDELLALPEFERNRIVAEQMDIIAELDDVIEDGFDIVND